MSVVPSPRGPDLPERGTQAEGSSGEASQTLDVTASGSQGRPPLSRPASSPLRVFENDELVVFRYRIRGLLGRGGMGEVYEAEDLELRERIALKVLRRELAERPGALEQLKREVALARKVSHPNVCRLFDVGFHLRTSASGSERICFLTMELLQGESLSALLRRTGALPPAEVLPLVRQLCEGLHAAHEAGIIHRDLKSANVLLVGARPGTPPPRAVITDFGLARLVGEAQATPWEPGTRPVGTPAYMAPEQLEGGPVTPATDLYALGIILFELLTGTRPFQGGDAWSTATQRLHAPAPSPRRLRPELKRRWETLILRCLERQPERRFQRALAVLAALPAPRRAVRPLPGLRDRGRRALTLLALLVGGLLVGPHVPPPDASLTRPAPARRCVAILGFVDQAGRAGTASLSALLTQALSIEVRAGERLRYVSITNATKAALSLEDAESLPSEQLARLREHLGCEFVLLGSYSVTESSGAPSLRLALRLQDPTGATVVLVEEGGPLAKPLPLLARAGGRLREALGVRDVMTSPPLESILPSGIAALRLYDEGMAKLHQQDGAGAQALFEQVIALEPDPSLPRARLASALIMKGERSRAREEFSKLLSRPERLSLKDRLHAQAMFAGYTPDWKRAAEFYQRLFELFPDELEAGLPLMHGQLAAGDPTAALATLARLRERSPPPVLAVMLDNAEAKAARMARDFPRAQAAAPRAATQAETWKDWFSAGVNRSLEADALYQQGARERAGSPALCHPTLPALRTPDGRGRCHPQPDRDAARSGLERQASGGT